MLEWLEWARGPAFVFSFTLMMLGLIRNIFLTVWGIIRSIQRAGDKNIPWKNLFISSMTWVLPFKKLKERFWYSMASILFHVGLILVPIFLIEHVGLWRRGIGFTWPTISQSFADGLTLLTIAMIIALFIGRLASKEARALSRPQDIILLLILAVPFVSGFLASHPTMNPFSYNATMLIHVLGSNLVMCLLPFTKLCHSVLLPLSQIVAEVGWRFPPNTGKNVAISLGKEVDAV